MISDLHPRVYFRNLDILRFIAAYLIVCLHCFFCWKAFFGHPVFLTSIFPGSFIDKLEILVHNFSFGVDVFFIISGFLITYLLLSEYKKTGAVDVMKFYIRRAFRIWPLYFFMILIAPLLSYFFYEQSPGYFYHFLFVGNFDLIEQGSKSVATDHLWSICIEEHFYLFCPLLIVFIPAKRLPQVLLGIIFATILFRAWVSFQPGDYGKILYLHTLSRIDVLALGSLFGYLYFHRRIKFNHPLPVRIMAYITFIVVFALTDYAECRDLFNSTVKKYFFVLMAAYWAGNFLFNPDARFAVTKPNLLHRFGKASYGIYMLNPVVIFLVLKLFIAMNWQNFFVYVLLVHVLLFAATYLSYRYLELPFLALKERYAVIKSGEVIQEPTPELTGEETLAPQKIIPMGKINSR